MKYTEFNKLLGKLEPNQLSNEDAERLCQMIEEMIRMLDDSDMDDYFGTEGWKHHIGME